MEKVELVFIPSPGIGHLVSTVELAKLLIERDQRLSITILIMKLPFDTKINTYTQSVSSDPTRGIKFVNLPQDENPNSEIISPHTLFSGFVEGHKARVRDAVAELTRPESTRLAGFVIDMFCTTMIDVANEFGVPTYVFFTSSAAILSLLFHFQALCDEGNYDVTEWKDSVTKLTIPSFINPVPAKVLPTAILDKGESTWLLPLVRKFREVKGIMINTFSDLESHAIKSLSEGNNPPVYPVGPILNLKIDDDENPKSRTILEWLDSQPLSSVVFLCFGSMGSFEEDQLKEIALGLEQSGCRFLWSLRRAPPKGTFEFPEEYSNTDEVLPEGFLKRTSEKGKVIGWAPQVAILSHRAVGGFVSHCGWNSTLESVWCGVPIAAWPLYAEQQMNAFQIVVELGMAVEIKMDYRKSFKPDNEMVIVTANEIENGIRRLMTKSDESNEIRKKVKEMKEKSRMALSRDGSSSPSLKQVIEEVIENIS